MRTIQVVTAVAATATMLGGLPAVQASASVGKPPAPSFTTTIKKGRKAVREALKQTASTSVSVALVFNGKRVWSQTFGRVTPAGKRPSATTKYGVGSVSKVVTAMAVMQLVDDGKISLDAPVVRYLPDFSMKSPQYRQITVRMLLNHSAGLPGTDYADVWSNVPIPTYVDRAMAGLANSWLKTTPGAMNVYCNDCFTLAGMVVERVSGMPFQDYVAANILKPLGMSHSGYQTSVSAAGTVAPIIDGGKAQPIEITNLFASGGLLSTAEDMARLAMVFTNGGTVGGTRILSRSAIDQMAADETATKLRVGPPGFLRYGLGWDSVQDPALKSAGVLGWTKGGDTVDYHASFAIAPDQRLGVVVLGAGQSFSSIAAETLAQTVLLNALVEIGATTMPAQVRGVPGNAKVTAKLARVKTTRLSGIFLAQNETLRLTKVTSRSLKVAKLVDGDWVRSPGRFELRDDGAFWATKSPGLSIRSVRAWGRTYVVQRSIGGVDTYYSHIARGQKTLPGGRLSPAWQARLGKQWLLANESPQSLTWTLSDVPAVTIRSIPGLPGYLLADGALVESVPFDATTSDTKGTMFLEIPLGFGRDLYDFDFAERDGQEYLSFQSSVLRPAATVPGLSPGTNPVVIGAQGLVQWYRVPNGGAVTITGQSDWKLFAETLSMIGSGGDATATVQAPVGAYLAVFGPPGRSATVVVGQ